MSRNTDPLRCPATQDDKTQGILSLPLCFGGFSKSYFDLNFYLLLLLLEGFFLWDRNLNSGLHHLSGISSPSSSIAWCFETGSPCVVQTTLSLLILLPQSPECWDYRCELLRPARFFIFRYL
jgi:hypothetical protein